MKLCQWEITASPACWNGYAVIARGDGADVNSALKDAASIIGSVWLPKNDGRQPKLLNVTIRRPDGTMFSVHPRKLKECGSPAQLEAAKEPL